MVLLCLSFVGICRQDCKKKMKPVSADLLLRRKPPAELRRPVK